MKFFRPTHPLNLENSRFLFFFLKPSLREGVKKNLEFFRFSLTHPPPKNGQNLEKKLKFYSPKMIFRQFWAVWEFFFIFSPYKMMHIAAGRMMAGVADMMVGAADMIGVQATQCTVWPTQCLVLLTWWHRGSDPPPLYGKK